MTTTITTTMSSLCRFLIALSILTIDANGFTLSKVSKSSPRLFLAGGDGGALGKPSYSDGALFEFHMMTQAQKIRDYVALDTYVDTDSLWNLEWHDSFVRNGLSDFVPPLTDTLNVLVVGGSGNKGGGVHEPGMSVVFDPSIEAASVASTPLGTTELFDEESESSLVESPASSSSSSQDSSCNFLAAVFDDMKENPEEEKMGGSTLAFETYDCIMDQGLMSDLVVNPMDNKDDIGRLLWEATKRIREHGVYVVQTPQLNHDTKSYLQNLGELLGLEWQFELDGISDANLSVSVARKYFKEELPSFGKLAKIV